MAQIEFVVPLTSSAYARSRSAPQVKAGEKWLLFLQASDLGLYPFAGRNSFLRIKGDKLFNNDVEYSRTRREATKAIRESQR
jgi:hypothetical protein